MQILIEIPTWLSVLNWSAAVLLMIICAFLVLLVLIQKGRGGGIAGAFGGGGGNTAFGSKTGDVLTWATSVVFGIFLLLAVVTNLTANAIQHQRALLIQQPKVAPTPTPAPETGTTDLSGLTPSPTTAPSTAPAGQ